MSRLAAARAVLAVAVALAPECAADDPSPRKALIEFGWDEPSTAFLLKHLAEIERAPFDGCVFHVDGNGRDGKPVSLTWEGWGRRAIEPDALNAARDDLAALRPTRLTRNFLRFNATPGDVDWFDDFAPIIANARLAASLARVGRCAGVLLDTEPYQGRLFTFKAQRDARSKGWDAYAAQARRRGREVMDAFQAGYPDPTILLTFGHSLAWRESKQGAKPLAEIDNGLLAPFLDGMIDAARGASKIVDGFELSYGYRAADRFADGYASMKQGTRPIVADPAVYARVVSAGFGLWLDHDWRKNGWNSDDPSRNYFTPESFESSVRAALKQSDEYVWIYTETPRWWSDAGATVKLPAAYDAALRRARQGLTPP